MGEAPCRHLTGQVICTSRDLLHPRHRPAPDLVGHRRLLCRGRLARLAADRGARRLERGGRRRRSRRPSRARWYADLLAAGPDPGPVRRRQRGSRCTGSGRPTGRTGRRFTFEPGDDQRHDLVVRRPGHLATVLLNGTEIARTANQHRSYRFDVTALLVARRERPGGPLRGSGHGGRPAVRRARRPAARVRAPVQRDPQDGRRLRLGLGSRPGRGRDLEVGRDRVLERRPAGLGPSAGPGRRHRRSAGDPRRAGVGRRRGRRRSRSTSPSASQTATAAAAARADRGRARAHRPRRRAVVAARLRRPDAATT